MGRQAKLKQRQRTARKQAIQQHRAEYEDLVEDPELHQLRIAAVTDPRAVEIRERDHAAQLAALGTAGWRRVQATGDGLGTWDAPNRRIRVVHSVAAEDDGGVWAHVSVSQAGGQMPDWYLVRDAGWLLYPGQFGIIVVAPRGSHVNISNVAHIWYRLDQAAVPDFSKGRGTI